MEVNMESWSSGLKGFGLEIKLQLVLELSLGLDLELGLE